MAQRLLALFDFAMLLGQASGMAFLGTLPCGKSCYISINGNAKSSWSEGRMYVLS
ncbi:hypothetical protein Pint_03939 [Pistacia integerrima]|uniref:Uncharacterized protein n=1 Tax=Pistacia integerrima TaxID=434235 RepID=A0ACC0Z0X4_9ROSI|nr:hypothetical protein Pint_03939 [Pistacia integerrima]